MLIDMEQDKEQLLLLLFYDSFRNPTAMKIDGNHASSREEAERVKGDFLKIEERWNGLFRMLFEGNEKDYISEIDERVVEDSKRGYKTLKLAMTTKGGAKIEASSDLICREVLEVGVQGGSYRFSQTNSREFVKFSATWLDEGDYKKFVEPYSATGMLPKQSMETKKLCQRKKDDGSCWATLKAKAVPELMGRIISYSKG